MNLLSVESKERGFSLTELLVALGIAGVIVFLFVQILLQSNGLFYQQSVKVDQGLTLNDAISLIGSDIKSATAVASGYPADSPTVLSSANSLVLQLASIDNSGEVINNSFDYLVIAPDQARPQVLREQLFPDPSSSRKSINRVLLSNLSKVTFYYLDTSGKVTSPSSSSRVNFTINLSSGLGSITQQSSASGQVSLRNL